MDLLFFYFPLIQFFFFPLATRNTFPPAGKCKSCKSSSWRRKIMRNVSMCSSAAGRQRHKHLSHMLSPCAISLQETRRHRSLGLNLSLLQWEQHECSIYCRALIVIYIVHTMTGNHRVRMESLGKTTSSIPGF